MDVTPGPSALWWTRRRIGHDLVYAASMDPDFSIRQAAFDHLNVLVAAHGPVLPWNILGEPFDHRGDRIRLANMPKGIFRPKSMTGGALSIKTTVPKRGHKPRYDDQVASGTGHFVYQLERRGPLSSDNQQLRRSFELGAPMVYLYGIAPALYRPLWPVFVVGWDQHAQTCNVSVDELGAPSEDVVAADQALTEYGPETVIRRRYTTILTKKRLHQDAFRALVLRAYKSRCAVCGLPRDELLDAAHIIPDEDVRGRPEVSNGLALCQLHHRAYDRNIVGISADYEVRIAPRVMGDRDGPVLEHAIKGMQGRRIRLPVQATDHPRRDYLHQRFLEFVAAG